MGGLAAAYVGSPAAWLSEARVGHLLGPRAGTKRFSS